MTDLDQMLRSLPLHVSWPDESDLAPAVVARLLPRNDRRWLKRLAPVVAISLVLIAAPSTRERVLAFFGLRGLTVEQGSPIEPGVVRDLGEEITLEDAEKLAGRTLGASRLGVPDRQFRDPEGRIWLMFGSSESSRNGALVTIFDADTTPAILKRLGDPQTQAVQVLVRGEPGLWLTGDDHSVFFESASRTELVAGRLSDNALIWQSGRHTLRLEADLDLEQALIIAESFD